MILVPNLYGLMVGLGIVVGASVAERLRQWIMDNGEWKMSGKVGVWDVLLWMIVPGIVGARLYHVVDYWQEVYVGQWWLIPQVWTGGLGIYGALLGGMVGLWLFCKRHKQNFLQWLDVIAFGLPIGQAIGRCGNYFNQELYGKLTSLPWGIYIEPQHRLVGYEQYSYFHPAFLYESLWSLVTFGVLLVFARRYGMRLKSGTFFTLYLLFYFLGRFFLEYIKIPDWTATMPNQLISGIIFLVSIGLLVRRAR